MDQTIDHFTEFLNHLKNETFSMRRQLKAVTSERDTVLTALDEAKTARDAALARVKELESQLETATQTISKLQESNEEADAKLRQTEMDSERVQKLEEDVASWVTMYDKLKTEKENLEMTEFRPLCAQHTKLNNELEGYRKEITGLQKANKKKSADLNRLLNENQVLKRQCAEQNSILSEKDSVNGNLTSNLSAKKQEILNLRNEIGSLKNLNSALEAKVNESSKAYGEMKSSYELDLLTWDSLRGEKETMEEKFQQAELKKSELEGKMQRFEALYDAGRKDGTGILLKSGAMLSFKDIAKCWRDSEGFNGTTSFPVKCPGTTTTTTTSASSTVTTTTVVHERAVLNFIRKVALNTTLATDYLFYFKFSQSPSNAPQQQAVRWKVYDPYDQLTLIAKTIFMYRSKEDESNFRTELGEEGHFVTAVCTKDPSSSTRKARFSLNVFTKNGKSYTHRIQFVDSSSVGESLFPDKFVIS